MHEKMHEFHLKKMKLFFEHFFFSWTRKVLLSFRLYQTLPSVFSPLVIYSAFVILIRNSSQFFLCSLIFVYSRVGLLDEQRAKGFTQAWYSCLGGKEYCPAE